VSSSLSSGFQNQSTLPTAYTPYRDIAVGKEQSTVLVPILEKDEPAWVSNIV
jgi:hypothetical protein